MFPAIGALVGGALFKGGKAAAGAASRSRERDKAWQAGVTGQTSALVEEARERLATLSGQSATTSETYTQGKASLMEMLKGQERRDAGSAAMRGLAGSELEIAQGGNRLPALVSGERSLRADSEQMLEQRRQAALAQLFAATGMDTQTELALKDRSDRRRQMLLQMLTQLVSGGVQAAAGAGGGQAAGMA
jgi:hypothetical protein